MLNTTKHETDLEKKMTEYDALPSANTLFLELWYHTHVRDVFWHVEIITNIPNPDIHFFFFNFFFQNWTLTSL